MTGERIAPAARGAAITTTRTTDHATGNFFSA
jgi:hypothetical protein